MKVDRSLLFGVLALQRECITAAQLAQANVDLAAGGGESLDAILAAKGWITSGQRSEINRLLDKHLQTHGGDYRKALEAIGDVKGTTARPPIDSPGPAVQIEETLDSVDAAAEGGKQASGGDDDPSSGAIDDTMDSMPDQVAKGEPQPLETIDYEPEYRSRYSLTRVEGEGGYGQVWLAFDPNLKREIAFKNIRPDKDARPEIVKSLIREAQITGQLEHPNIIPIYELEHADERGRPYYTMPFLRGETLGDRIKEYHERRKAGEADPLDLPQLLNAFVDICNALAYAGSRGIVHRDLKPANIMLGDFGRVLVLDWGLAKEVGERDFDQDAEDSEDSVIANADETAHGQIKGTLAYMAPEQAAGRPDLIDERTDVYGLGAILFAVLTGRAPHKGDQTGNTAKDTMELLKRNGSTRSPPTLFPNSLATIPRMPNIDASKRKCWRTAACC